MSASRKNFLVITHPQGAEEKFRLEAGAELRLGRGAECDVVLDDPGASRVHTTVTATPDGILVADNASTNGTFVDGERIEVLRVVQPGQVIDIGSTKIRLHMEDEVTQGSGGRSRAMTAQLHPVSISVLVATVRDYKVLLELFPKPDVDKALVAWTKKISEVVKGEGGQVYQLLGPSVVALWVGKDEQPLAQHASQTLFTAKKFTDFLHGSSLWPHRDTYPWKASFVLNTARGLQGKLGIGSGESDFSLLGDPINETFEMLKCVEALESLVVISENTAKLVDSVFECKPLGDFKLKSEATERMYDLKGLLMAGGSEA